MDEDEDLYKRDVTAPTGDDHFDKSVLPKALQVRKDAFGKIGRTKYASTTLCPRTLLCVLAISCVQHVPTLFTPSSPHAHGRFLSCFRAHGYCSRFLHRYTHLADQDTSKKDSAWSQKTPIAARMEKKRGGTANIFERPSGKRKKDV